MSSLYRSHTNARIGRGILAALTALGALGANSSKAAQYYVQPTAELSAETNTNITLDPVLDSQRSEGYVAALSAVIGAATPRSETTLIPSLEYQQYPDYEEANRLQGSLDFFSTFRSVRAENTLYGRYEHRDEIDANLGGAQFDELNPNAPTVPETGRVRAGATRDLVQFNPTFSYALTQLVKAGGSALYQAIDYSPSGFSAIDYDYYQADVYLERAFTQRLDVSLGAYANRYEAQNVASEADGVGGALDFQMRWTETFTGNLRLSAEQNESTLATPPFVGKEKVTAWGAEVNLARRGEVSQFRLGAGREIAPSGNGGMYYVDQIQLVYNRDLSQRTSIVTAVRLMRESPISTGVPIADRDYIRTDLGIQWMLSQTWYIRAGYEYIWQEYELDPGSADNHKAVLAFGYKGLGPQR